MSPTKTNHENGNGHRKALSAKTVIPLGVALVFGGYAIAVAVGEANFKSEVRHDIQDAKKEREAMARELALKLDMHDFASWVREHKALVGPLESAKIPDPPR